MDWPEYRDLDACLRKMGLPVIMDDKAQTVRYDPRRSYGIETANALRAWAHFIIRLRGQEVPGRALHAKILLIEALRRLASMATLLRSRGQGGLVPLVAEYAKALRKSLGWINDSATEADALGARTNLWSYSFKVGDPDPDTDEEFDRGVGKAVGSGSLFADELERIGALLSNGEPEAEGIAQEFANLGKSRRARPEVGTRARKSPQSPEVSNLEKLNKTTPTFDRENQDWVKNKIAARLDGLETETLKKYRFEGIKTADSKLGQDKDGRVWRRPGLPNSHPWYLKSTLRSQQK